MDRKTKGYRFQGRATREKPTPRHIPARLWKTETERQTQVGRAHATVTEASRGGQLSSMDTWREGSGTGQGGWAEVTPRSVDSSLNTGGETELQQTNPTRAMDALLADPRWENSVCLWSLRGTQSQERIGVDVQGIQITTESLLGPKWLKIREEPKSRTRYFKGSSHRPRRGGDTWALWGPARGRCAL